MACCGPAPGFRGNNGAGAENLGYGDEGISSMTQGLDVSMALAELNV